MSNLNSRIASFGISFLIITFLLVYSLSAATVTGKITDATSGDYLPGANVMLEGISLGAATDRAGDFTIPNVPVGDYTLYVTYIGYEDYFVNITVAENVRDNHFVIVVGGGSANRRSVPLP